MKDEKSSPSLFEDLVILVESEEAWQHQEHKVALNRSHSSEPIMSLYDVLAQVLHLDLKELKNTARIMKFFNY